MRSLSTFYTSKAIIAYFSVLMICAWLAIPRFLPFIWIFTGVISVFSFFYFCSYLLNKWLKIPAPLFLNKIFLTSLIIRIIYVFIAYYFYQVKNGTPFEFNAGDSIGYHGEALYIIRLFERNLLGYYFKDYLKGFSDAGWPMILAMIYLFSFKSIFLVRIFNAIISSFTVVLIYKISKRNFGENSARITAVMAMLLPALIYYSGLHLKETTMVFILIAFMERADNILRSHNLTVGNIIIVILLGTSLFFFRTVLAAAAWFSLFSTLLLSSDKIMSQYRRIVIFIWLIIAASFVFSGSILKEVSIYFGERKTNQEQKYEHFSTRVGANQLARYGNTAIFIPIIIPAPFPTLVNIPGQENLMMTNGDLFTRNVYAFFVFVAFYVLYKKKMVRNNLLLSIFLASYLLILANSGYALSPRFHVPALPFLLLFAGYGITQTNRNYASYYVLYLIIISTIVIGWNWFKLAGRGMI